MVQKKIDNPRGRLARLIRYTDGEPKEMIKHCIQQPASVGYKNARSLLEEKYGNPHYIVAAYRKEIKSWPQLKPADGTAYRRFYNFLLKFESATYGQNWNTIDTPEMMCLVLSKLMKRSSVYKLDPFIDERGLLRVGGRLRKSNLHFIDVHPILLSKDSCITRLIVEWCHQKTAHGGRGLTINEIRSNGFWVV